MCAMPAKYTGFSDNPFVQAGKCTEQGRSFLEATETVTVVRYEGLVKHERTYERKEWTQLWLTGEPWVVEWYSRTRKSFGV